MSERVYIGVSVPADYCMKPGGPQCPFIYPTGKEFRCRYFDTNVDGKRFLIRDAEYKTHRLDQCIKAELEREE